MLRRIAPALLAARPQLARTVICRGTATATAVADPASKPAVLPPPPIVPTKYTEKYVPGLHPPFDVPIPADYTTPSGPRDVYFDIRVGPMYYGRVVFRLADHLLPKTCANFRALCTGENGVGTMNKNLSYHGSRIHRIVKRFIIQGGDIVNHDGTSGESIYGPTFEDENFKGSHHAAGILSMANLGRNTNSSQWFVTLKALPGLDRRFVAFGRVLYGMEVLKRLEYWGSELDSGHAIHRNIHIVSCGEYPPPRPPPGGPRPGAVVKNWMWLDAHKRNEDFYWIQDPAERAQYRPDIWEAAEQALEQGYDGFHKHPPMIEQKYAESETPVHVDDFVPPPAPGDDTEVMDADEEEYYRTGRAPTDPQQ